MISSSHPTFPMSSTTLKVASYLVYAARTAKHSQCQSDNEIAEVTKTRRDELYPSSSENNLTSS